MPPGARRLLEAALGQSPQVKSLNLYWTSPGPFDAPGNVESLHDTLAACPHVERLRIISASDSSRALSPSTGHPSRGVPEQGAETVDIWPKQRTIELEPLEHEQDMDIRARWAAAARADGSTSSDSDTPHAPNSLGLFDLDRSRASSASSGASSVVAGLTSPALAGALVVGPRAAAGSVSSGSSSLAARSSSTSSGSSAPDASGRRDRSTSIAEHHKHLPVLAANAEADSAAPPVAVHAAVQRAARRLGRQRSLAAGMSRVVEEQGGAGLSEAALARRRSVPHGLRSRARACSASTDEGWETFVGSLLAANAPRAAAAP
jgi:hypothetical protein